METMAILHSVHSINLTYLKLIEPNVHLMCTFRPYIHLPSQVPIEFDLYALIRITTRILMLYRNLLE